MTEPQRPQFTRIHGLSDRRRLPRIGRIRLGERRTTRAGKEYPAALNYFKFDDDTLALYPKLTDLYAPKRGEFKPKMLSIMFPDESTDIIFPQSYKLYGASSGLKCKGNGQIARRRICTKCKQMGCKCPDPETALIEVSCPCPYQDKGGDCKPVGSLMIMLPNVTWEGVWQIDTSSKNSIIDLNSGIDFIRGLCGRIALVPIKLWIEPRQVQAGARAMTVHTLHIAFAGDTEHIKLLRAQARPDRLKIEAPHDEGDELPPIPDTEPESAPEPDQDSGQAAAEAEERPERPHSHDPAAAAASADPADLVAQEQIDVIRTLGKKLQWDRAEWERVLALFGVARLGKLSKTEAKEFENLQLKQIERVRNELVEDIEQLLPLAGVKSFDNVIAAGGLPEPWTDSGIEELREVRDELKGMLNGDSTTKYTNDTKDGNEQPVTDNEQLF